MRTELVTTLKRQATELLADVERDREPILITQHGLPSAYLVDVESYRRQQERMAILEGIARGEMAVTDGRVVSEEEAERRLDRWLKKSGPSRRWPTSTPSRIISPSKTPQPPRRWCVGCWHVSGSLSITPPAGADRRNSPAPRDTGNSWNRRAGSSTARTGRAQSLCR